MISIVLYFQVYPELFLEATIFFSQIVGFGEITKTYKIEQVVKLLNKLYKMFDAVISKYDVYKIETISQSHMIASGL